MSNYDNETLKKVQQYELSILRDFVKICDENNLTYFGIAGTGIGSLRHEGFIPWDDDIDVGIMRNDLDKLIEIIQRDYSDKYYILNAENNKNFPLTTTHICIKDSQFVLESLKGTNCPYGIFLDVFPFDCVSSDEKTLNKQMKRAWIYSKILILRHLPFPIIAFKGFTKKFIHFCTAIIHGLMKFFGISHKFLYNKIIKASCKYNGTDTGVYAYFCGGKPTNNIFKKEDMFPLRKLKFEDIELNFPNKLEAYLTHLYGDFMQLPPPEKRVSHSPCVLKFPNKTAEEEVQI